VVTWAGERSGYGKLVEINHGDGYLTRYAHNERLLVTVGQTVTRGEAIALMGSTGRSTGPHVHFEVVRNGRQVDPLSYVGR
jgi:murein DD-endopeptidase MepM/ murein hydrolase activator NlpD